MLRKNSWAQAENGDRLSCPGNAGSVWSASASTVALLALESSKWGFNTTNIYFSKNTILCGIISSSPSHTKLFAQTLSVEGEGKAFFCCGCFQWRASLQLSLSRGSVNRCAGETEGLKRTGNRQLEEGGCLNQDSDLKRSVFVKMCCIFKPQYCPHA